MVFFNRTGNFLGKITRATNFFFPFSVAYAAVFTRKNVYRLGYMIAFCCAVGFFRRPYVIRNILKKEEQEIQQKGSALQQTLNKLQIRLSEFSENYFVVIAGHSSQRQQELEEKQKIAFELNSQINSKLEISPNFYKDIKILFIGNKNIYELLSTNQTIVELYQKEKEQNDASAIYIFARQADGSQKFLNSLPFKADLNSILRIISKHRARKFASSVQF